MSQLPRRSRTLFLLALLVALVAATSSPAGASVRPAHRAVADTAVKVWVNTASGVYHCSGSRFYGTTKEGTYLAEPAARAKGYRPAYGRECGDASAAPSPAPLATAAPGSAGGAKVWVNTASGVYHCPGSSYYGATKTGTYMTEPEAKAAGHRPAYGKPCS